MTVQSDQRLNIFSMPLQLIPHYLEGELTDETINVVLIHFRFPAVNMGHSFVQWRIFLSHSVPDNSCPPFLSVDCIG